MKKRLILLLAFSVVTISKSQTGWRSIGPNVGNIVRLEVNSNGHVFAGSTINAGLNRTTDGGISWKKISGNYRFFAAGGNQLFDAPANGALRYSSDFGETWVTRSSPSSSIVQLYFTIGSLYLATYDGLYRSNDLGVSFVLLRSHVHTPGSFQFGIAQGPNGTIFTSGNYNYPSYEAAYYRSTDGGQTWTRMPWFGWVPHWAFNSTGQVFIAAGSGVWKSSNDGDSWVQVSAESNVKSIGIDSDDRVFITTDAYVLRSTDNGATWTQVITGMDRAGGGKLLCITPSGDLYSGSSSGPLYSSTDSGNSWVESGLPIAIVKAFAISPRGKFFAACGFNLAFTSTNAGSVWNRTGFYYPDYHEFLIADTAISALGALDIDLSADNGATWRRPFYGAFPDFLYSGMVSRQGRIFVGTAQGILRSDDRGNTWQRAVSTSSVYSIAEGLDGTIYAGGQSDFLKSSDTGQSWISIREKAIKVIASTRTGVLIAGTPFGFERSTDGGATWTVALSTGVEVRGFLVHPAGLFAATYGWGILESTDDGASWCLLTEQPASLWLTSIAVDADNRLCVGSDGDGIFRSSTPLTGTSRESSRQPVQFRLDQNYPNPFNPTTTIEFHIPRASLVILRVFDILGREVATLANEEMEPGRHAREFTGTGLASGIYLYRLRAGDFVQTRKLLVLR